jgi:hypothetical protein
LVWTSACDRIPSLLRMEATLVEEVAIALTSRRVAKMCLLETHRLFDVGVFVPSVGFIWFDSART